MMDVSEVEENMFVAADAKLHGEICRKLSVHVCKILEIFPILEAARPRSKSGIQSLCSLHVALDRAKNLLRHCSTCSKLYLAITGDSILLKFEKTKGSLQESLTRVEDIAPQAVGCQIMNIVGELEGTTFTLDESEKRSGDELIQLLQTEKKFDGNSNDMEELETFHQAALQLGITSSRAALTERRALKKIIERARAEEDKRKESIVAYLLHLMRKYSKLFRSEVSDDTDSQGSAPCSPTVQGGPQDSDGHGGIHAFDRQLSKLCSFNFKPTGMGPGSMPLPPEEFRCPISLQLMYDPVIISSGHTYERVCIEKWFSDGHVTCPKTKQHLSHLSLTPNYCAKGLIASWCEHNGFPIPSGPPDSLDLNYWRLVLSEHAAADPRSVASIDSCKTRSFKATPFKQNNEREDNAAMEEPKGNSGGNLANSNFNQEDGIDEYVRYENLLACLYNGKTVRERQHAVEQIRFLLKDDEEARVYMGANGFTEGLVQFLRSAVEGEDEDAQEVGAMALFNLAVNNNRNKGLMLSSGVIPLLEEMISNSIYESATALYLNLSCLDDAKSAIGASRAVPLLVQILRNDDNKAQCRADALHTLFNLSTDQPNIPSLLSAGIVEGLHSLITGCAIPDEATWTEKAVAIFINLALSNSGKKTIVATPGLVGAIASLLDTAERSGQEKVVCCLLLLCDGDQACCDMVLQEGVVPVLVSVSVNGTARGKEKARKLLMMFREQRQREPSSPTSCQQQPPDDSNGASLVTTEGNKTLVKTVSRRRVGSSLSSMWKNKHFSLYQC